MSLPPLTVQLRYGGPSSVISLHGEVDISTAPSLDRALELTAHDVDVSPVAGLAVAAADVCA